MVVAAAVVVVVVVGRLCVVGSLHLDALEHRHPAPKGKRLGWHASNLSGDRHTHRETDWTGLLRQQDSNTPAPYVLDVRRAAAKLLLFVVATARATPGT